MKLRHILGGLALALVSALAGAASLVTLPQQLVVDADGTPRSGALLTTYVCGTTTPLTTYTTPALSVSHTNPIVAVSTGLFPAIYLPPSVTCYKLKLEDSAGVDLYTEDNIPAGDANGIAQTVGETSAGVTAVNLEYPVGHTKRYDATCDGVADDTAEVQAAIDVASEIGGTATIQTGTCLVDTLTIDASNFTIEGEGEGSILKASSDIPASGAILLSLAGGSDATVNDALLDGIYGSNVFNSRSVVTGSLENVQIRNLRFQSNTVAARGIWMTGFTRGCVIEASAFENFDGSAIVLNGSWSFSLISNHISGDGTNGTGLSLGIIGNGERNGVIVVNAAHIAGNTINSHANGVIWNIGAGLFFGGNTVELNVADGFQSQSGNGATLVGNYFENNADDNVQIGGTNGIDFFEGCQIIGNIFTTNSGNNINLRGTQRCRIGPNYFSGTVTQHYFIASSGSVGQYVTENEVWVPAISGTYIANSTQFDSTDNFAVLTDSALYQQRAPRLHAQVSLTTAAAATLGLFGVTAVSQQSDIGAMTDSSGGTANDTVVAISGTGDDGDVNNNFADLADAINDMRAVLRAYGLMP